MATDFAVSLRRFLTDHLAGLRGYSTNTIVSYRDAFKLLICYFRDQQSIPPEKLTLERIDAAAITGFLDWLRTSRGNSASTCNQRLAAIDSFFTWMQTQDPARMACCQDILAIPASRDDQPAVTHLSVEQTPRLLAAPDRSTRAGRRDATLLATLYDTAARVQELADLSVRDIRLDGPAMAALTGKGRKTRPGQPIRRSPTPTSVRIHCATVGPCTSTTPAFHCPTFATSSATSTCPPPRSTHGPPPRPNAKHSKPSMPTSSPPTWPNGTRTPNCSTGSPTSDRVRLMRSVRSPPPPPPAANPERYA